MAQTVPDGCPLTQRRFEVLLQLCDGKSYDDIAGDLGISRSTVRSHAMKCYELLGVDNIRQAISEAGKRGWLGWQPQVDVETPLSAETPFLAAYLQEFVRSGWPHEPDPRSLLGMRLALAGHRNQMRSRPKGG